MVSREVLAEAARWVVRLHGPDCTPQVEAEFQAWKVAAPAHPVAYEHCMGIWDALGRLTPEQWASSAVAQTYLQPRPAAGDDQADATPGLSAAAPGAGARAASPHRVPAYVVRGGWARLSPTSRWGLAAVMAVAGVAAWLGMENMPEPAVFETTVGEQRSVSLEDGSRMTLNTATRLAVDFQGRRREVRIEEGEALFEVAKNPRRPFVVRVGDTEVTAVGTAFVVRSLSSDAAAGVSVTVLEGRVKVDPDSDARHSEAVVTMSPGETVRVRPVRDGHAVTAKKRLPPSQLASWRHQYLEFDQTPLAEAVAEVNRYTEKKIVVVGDTAASRVRVTGGFRTGDGEGFARDVALNWGLQVHDRDGRWEVSDIPR